MRANFLDGRTLALSLREGLRMRINKTRAAIKRAPCLAVILVGEHPASLIYVENKHKACALAGIEVEMVRLPERVTTEALLTEINRLNLDEKIDGILVQLPLPQHVESARVTLRIDPSKDVDGFHPYNMGMLALKIPALRPATPKGIMLLLQHYLGDIKGKNAVVIGASNTVGRPMALELLNHRATVTICHSQTENLIEKVREANLVIAAVGIPHFVKGEWVKPGAIVVDVGINRLSNGKLAGDVDFDEVARVASFISPVPGGVGPMTIAALLDNIVMAYEKTGN